MMNNSLPPLNWLRAFEASARLGNFTRAAETLNLTPAAVSHQVRSLEQHLGAPLFERHVRSLALTRLGEAYLPGITKAFGDISRTTQGVFGPKQPESIKLRALNSFTMTWLIPRLVHFYSTHPDIQIELHSSAWPGEMRDSNIDFEIKYGHGKWPDGHSELLKNDPIIVVGHPDLLPLKRPQIPAFFQTKPLIEIMGVTDNWSRFFLENTLEIPKNLGKHHVDQSLTAMEMAAFGMGFALVAESFAHPYLESKRLVRACPQTMRTDQGHYLVFHQPDSMQTAAQIKFRTWLFDIVDREV